jgi:HD-GYP domain-containing protein (c-di-GMP phosphodiesterase class II)
MRRILTRDQGRVRRRGVGWWLAVGTAALAACVAVVFLALLSSMAGLQKASDRQQIAAQEVASAGDAQRKALEMDNAVRGFILTHESGLLARYYTLSAGFAVEMKGLILAERSAGGIQDPPTVLIARQMHRYEQGYAGPLLRLAAARQLSARALRDAAAAGQRRMDALDLVFERQTALSSGDALRGGVIARAQSVSTRRYVIFGSAGLLLLIAAFVLALRRGIALPLGRLRTAAEHLARGDRGARMPRARLRELDDVSRSFDGMADALTAGRDALVHQNGHLEQRVRERTRDLEAARVEILTRLARAAEFRDNATREHTDRVARTAGLLGRILGLTVAEIDLLMLAAPLHDIGKIGIPDAVLLKPGKLTGEEFAVMKTHAQLGAEMLAGSDSPVLQLGAQIALNHHERWDGTGYPQRLHGEQIPLAARIVAVADVFDALTQQRPYKPPWSLLEAVKEITEHSGHQFDPRVVDALHQIDNGQLIPRDVHRPAARAHANTSPQQT